MAINLDSLKGEIQLETKQVWLVVDKDSSISNNTVMTQSVEQIVRDSIEAMDSVRRKYNTPAKARQFLLKIGILEKHKRSKNGVRLAKRFR